MRTMPLGHCHQKAACPAVSRVRLAVNLPRKTNTGSSFVERLWLQLLKGSAEEIWSLGQLEWEGPSETHFGDGDSSLHMALAHHLDLETTSICLWLSLLNT